MELSLDSQEAFYIKSLLLWDRRRRVKTLDIALTHKAIEFRENALIQIEAIDELIAKLEEKK